MTTRWTVGINHSIHESSACLLRDSELVFATAEERLSRVKHDSSFPRLAIEAALDFGGITPKQVSAVGFSFPSHSHVHTIQRVVSGVLSGSIAPSRWNTVGPFTRAIKRGKSRQPSRLLAPLWHDESLPSIFEIGHHRSHAWTAAMMTGDPCVVVVVDGNGARNSTSIWVRRHDGTLSRIYAKHHPDSLGLFYAKITQYLGFRPLADEWKVMGLAPFGSPGVSMDEFLKASRDDYVANGRALIGRSWHDLSALERAFGPARRPDDPIDERHKDIAFAAQAALEQAMLAIVRRSVALTGFRKVALAGGVALNCKANGLILQSGVVDDLVVQPAASDDGSAVGAAIEAFHRTGGTGTPLALTTTDLGESTEDDEIEESLRTYKIAYERVDDPARSAAERLANSQIVGWFQGRSEFGPRALGYRSILADPRDVRNRDLVNAAVKFREEWRPFAPSVLADHADGLFVGSSSSPFMILTFDATPLAAEQIPAVVHVDGTSRVQTVSDRSNPLYAALLHHFYKLTGVPAVMNTSFNLKGDPIVNTVRDAVQTFYSSGLDSLVIGHFVVDKATNQGSHFHG